MLHGTPEIQPRGDNRLRPGGYRGKRQFDLALVLMTAPVTLPVGILCALAVRLDSPGPIFFRQKRVGLNGGEFYMLKFRSMYVHSDDSTHREAFAKYVKGQKLAGIAKINLHNNVTDPSSMNEPLSYRLYRDAGVPAPRSAYARVFVTVPGKFDKEFFGLYSLVEDIDKHFTEEALGNGKAARARRAADDFLPWVISAVMRWISFARLLLRS